MSEAFLRHLSRWQAEQQGEPFADMYVEAYGGAPGQEYPGRQDFLRRFTDDLRHPGFDMVVATRHRSAATKPTPEGRAAARYVHLEHPVPLIA